ncbi:MAG: hypothetical protein CMJ64_18710 [Planctomycetaceae bacterium]|nr:hypothetical protein [Planctomycetaceae bacterium]
MFWANTNLQTYHKVVEFPINSLWEDTDHASSDSHDSVHEHGSHEADDHSITDTTFTPIMSRM